MALQEVEREAPNNAIVIFVFGLVGGVLQVAAVVMARKLARRRPEAESPPPGAKGSARECVLGGRAGPVGCDTDSDSGDADKEPGGPGWRKKANLRMYTIIDKIF